MSEAKPDRWNSLLETLGVPVSEAKPAPPAEAPAAESSAVKPQSTAMARQEKKAVAKPKPAAAPAKSPSYWSRIAGALGLEVAQEPEPTKAEEPEAEEPRREEIQERKTEETRTKEALPRERLRTEDRSSREFAPLESEVTPRSALDEMFGPKSPDVDVFDLGIETESPQGREPSLSQRGEDEDRGPILEYDLPEESGSDLSLDAGSPREERERMDEEHDRGGRRRRRRGRGRGRRGSAGDREVAQRPHEADIEPAGEETDFDLDRDEEFDLDAELRTDAGRQADQTERGSGREGHDERERFLPAGERLLRDDAEDRGGRSRRRRGRRGRRERDEISTQQPSPYGGRYR